MPRERRSSPPATAKPMPSRYAAPIYFLSLTVENVRCFGAPLTIDFTRGEGRPARWTVILGGNATGRTTVLQALVALAPVRPDWTHARDTAASRSTVQRFLHFPGDFNIWEMLPRRGELRSQLQAVLAHGRRLTEPPVGGRGGESFIEMAGSPYASDGVINYRITDGLGEMACFAYGVSRRMALPARTFTGSADPTASLFSDEASLRNAEEWLLQADYWASRESEHTGRAWARLEQVKQLVVSLLPGVDDLRLRLDPADGAPRPGVELLTVDGWIPLSQIGRSRQVTLAWLVDFASRLYECYPDSAEPLAEPAVALIDELDLHLGPAWVQHLFQELPRWFANTQFIVTAHSPLVVPPPTEANLVVLRRDGDRIRLERDFAEVNQWRAAELMVSDLLSGGRSEGT